ncbi:hypothetical protein Avbf_13561, partial [Armadillidium vulgare]
MQEHPLITSLRCHVIMKRKRRTRRIMYRQDDIARAMIDVQEGIIRLSGNVANPGHSGRGIVLLPMEEETLAPHIAVLGD